MTAYRTHERGSHMRHLTILCAASLVWACGSDFRDTFPNGPGGTGGGSGGEVPEGGSGGSVGGAGQGGVGTGATGAGGGAVCEPNASICEGSVRLVCASDGSEYLTDIDCATGNGLCAQGRCEYDLSLLALFDEGSGSMTFDESPNSLTGVLSDASWSSPHAIVGNSIYFDGSAEVSFGDALNNLSLPFSVSAWVKIPSGQSAKLAIVSTEHGNSNYAGIWLRVSANTGYALVAGFGDGISSSPTSRNSKVSQLAVPTDTWAHVAAIYRASGDADLFIDGADAGGSYSGSATSVGHGPGLLAVGDRAPWNEAFVGQIDDLRIYHRALTPSEVQELSEL